MIKENTIKVSVTSRNKTRYSKLGYDTSLNTIEIATSDLSDNSHIKITAICECGNETVIRYHKYIENKNRGGVYRCKKCSQKTRENTVLEKFGTDNIMKLDEFKLKGKQTKLEKYGDENYNNIKKHKETNLEKYGVDFVLKKKEFRDKGKITKLQKYGNENYVNVEKRQKSKRDIYYNNVINKYNLNFIGLEKELYCIKCDQGHEYKITHKLLFQRIDLYNVEPCLICNPLNKGYSGNEMLLRKFIEENYKKNILFNYKKIISKELDVYLPELNLAFEFNGVYWHNELYKPYNYHKIKSDLCEEKGIQLIHIWEDDWLYKQDIVKSMILNKLDKIKEKIFAHKCIVKEVNDNKIIKKFLDKNHIQGFTSSKIKLGLYYNNELISLMTFGKKRKNMNTYSKEGEGEWELLRFCNKLNTNVIGSASKLFKYFIINYNYKEITTYIDRSHSNGNLYKELGFNYISKTEPNYYYVIKDTRHHRYNFKKDILIKEGYDPNKSEHQIMLDRRIYRIYDAGNLKYIY
jgi:hypothetical protein